MDFLQCFLILIAAPIFTNRPEDQKVGLNGIAKFLCAADGNPPPSVFWTKEGSQVLMFPDNSYGHMRVLNDGTLHIPVSYTHLDVYKRQPV